MSQFTRCSARSPQPFPGASFSRLVLLSIFRPVLSPRITLHVFAGKERYNAQQSLHNASQSATKCVRLLNNRDSSKRVSWSVCFVVCHFHSLAHLLDLLSDNSVTSHKRTGHIRAHQGHSHSMTFADWDRKCSQTRLVYTMCSQHMDRKTTSPSVASATCHHAVLFEFHKKNPIGDSCTCAPAVEGHENHRSSLVSSTTDATA